MIFLFAFIAIGFLLARTKLMPEGSEKVLSKLENYLFVPALVMGTFIENCNFEKLAATWSSLTFAVAELLVFILLSLVFSRFLYSDGYMRKISTYCMAFSNFGFMGLAVIKGVFPEVFFEYTLFTLPLWFGIYIWGAPVLLIADNNGGQRRTIGQILKPFLNPMLIAMLIGIVLGLTGLNAFIPAPVLSVVKSSGDCMSPLAMLLTGMSVARTDTVKLFLNAKVYIFSLVKLIVFPAVYIAAARIFSLGAFIATSTLICGLNFAAMPAGLNAIVIPAAYGKSTENAAATALITHILSVGTLPLAFWIFQLIMNV